MAQVQGGTPPGSQYGVQREDWLRGLLVLGAGLAGMSRGRGQGATAAQAMLDRFQKQQARANQDAGYATSKPSQVLMDWVKKWITEQETTKMEALTEPQETEAP